MEFNANWSTEVVAALRKVNWQTVIASVVKTEGPLPESPNGIHDVLIQYLKCNIFVSRAFWRSLLENKKEWSTYGLEAARVDHVSMTIRLAIDVVDVLWRALTIHYPNIRKCKGVTRSLQATIIKYCCLAHDGDWAKFLKFHTNAFFSRYELDSDGNAQELPPNFGSDQPGTIFVGLLNQVVRQKGSSSSHPGRAAMFRFTIQQGMKKGFPLLDEESVHDSLCSGAKDLSAKKVVPLSLLSEIERTTKEVFGDSLGTYKEYLIADPYETLSTHACVNGPRSKGGAMGKAYAKVTKSKLLLHFWDSDLARVRFHPWLGTWEDRVPSWSIHYGDWLRRRREKALLAIIREGAPSILRGLGPSDQWTDDLQREVLEEISSLKGDSRKIVFRGILEPLKVRPISVSHMEANHIWQPIQKRMWRLLQRFPCFKLTGTPVTTEIITEFANQTKTLCDDRFPTLFGIMRAVSADFRAATNVLALPATLAAVESSTKCPLLRAIMRNGLVGSRMYVEKEKKEIDLGVQTNGQLMGCVFSFPFLCLINAAITRHALEREYGRKFRLDECPMLINGDDMLCFMTPSGYREWKTDSCAVGLEPSVGKNYFSDRFLMINSRIFDIVEHPLWGDYKVEVKPRPFVNFSFVTGVQKTGCNTDGSKEELGDDHCLKALSTFSQSLVFHADFNESTQAEIERHIWDRRKPLWTGLGLSTGPSGFDLKYSPGVQPDNRIDFILAKMKWGPYRKRLDLPCKRYESGPDYCGTWRLQSSLVRTTDVWRECSFIRRAMVRSDVKVCRKYRALVGQVNSLSHAARELYVSWKRFSREVSGRVSQVVHDWPNRSWELW